MKTKTKILIAKLIHIILIKILKFDQIKVIRRNSINWYLDLTEGLDLQIFLLGSFQRKIVNAIINTALKWAFNDGAKYEICNYSYAFIILYDRHRYG